eukprot:g45998.t1
MPAISELGVEHLLGEACVGLADDVPSPLPLIKGSKCLDARNVGLVEDSGVGAAVFLADLQDLAQQCWWYIFSPLFIHGMRVSLVRQHSFPNPNCPAGSSESTILLWVWSHMEARP